MSVATWGISVNLTSMCLSFLCLLSLWRASCVCGMYLVYLHTHRYIYGCSFHVFTVFVYLCVSHMLAVCSLIADLLLCVYCIYLLLVLCTLWCVLCTNAPRLCLRSPLDLATCLFLILSFQQPWQECAKEPSASERPPLEIFIQISLLFSLLLLLANLSSPRN